MSDDKLQTLLSELLYCIMNAPNAYYDYTLEGALDALSSYECIGIAFDHLGHDRIDRTYLNILNEESSKSGIDGGMWESCVLSMTFALDCDPISIDESDTIFKPDHPHILAFIKQLAMIKL